MNTFRRLVTVCLIALIATTGLASTALEIIPAAAPPGARLIVHGSGLQSGDLSVTFPDNGHGTPAIIAQRDAKYAEVVVPTNATSGGVQISDGVSQLATLPFTVTPDAEYETVQTILASDQAHDLLKSPRGIAIDPSRGTIYVSDTKHHRINAISADGMVILAGSGQPGFNDGVGRNASFSEPAGLALDRARKVLYVADSGNHAIRRVALDGTVMTLAGSGRPGDRDGVGNGAELKQPMGIAVDASGTIFVADTANSRIKRITPDGAVITIAGSGRSGFADGAALAARFAEPEGIAVDAWGAVVIADTDNHRVRRLAMGLVTTVAGSGDRGFADGTVLQSRFDTPRGVSIDDAGNLLIADTGNDVIRKVGATVTTIAGRLSANNGNRALIDGPALQSQFASPSALVFAGALFVTDERHDAVRIVLPHLLLTDLYPRRGPLQGGNEVQLFGMGFIPGRTGATVAGASAPVIVVTSTELLVTIPPGTSGPVDIVVTTPAGSAMLQGKYTYLAPPTLASITPRKGRIAGGERAIIRGTDLVSGETEILFGDVSAPSLTIDDPLSATVTTPAHASGVVDLIARTPAGETRLAGAFRYFARPIVDGVAPLQCRVGDILTIIGANFDADLSGNRVKIGEIPLTPQSASPTQLIVTLPAGALTGKITVVTAGGEASSSAMVVVLAYDRITIKPETSSLNAGESVLLTASGVLPNGTTEPLPADVLWTTSDSNVAIVATNGTVQGISSGTASITATYRGMSATAAITVVPALPLPPDPATIAPAPDLTVVSTLADEIRFLYSGANAIQTGVAVNVISDERATVFRGRVLKTNGLPRAGARVSVLNHPEYGETLSRADGYYDFVVNGGGSLTLRYEWDGAIAAQRLVSSQWNEQKSVDDVVLVDYDRAVTPVTLQSAAIQVVRGSISTDIDGARRATLLVPPNTGASLIRADGSIENAPTLHMRATEFTVGASGPRAMPAALPPTSGYTYCVELSADEAVRAGATEVRFTRPLPFYVENFLGFAVGGIVPVGYYDRIKGTWTSVDNGRVIKVLATSGGLAQIDADGNGSADTAAQLAALGIDAAEQQQVATLYAPGQTLWRVLVPHLTPYDLNWPFTPPAGAEPPKMGEPGYRRDVPYGCRVPQNSTVDCHNQTLSEEIRIAGTPFSLLYDSGRVGVGGFKTDIPLTGAALPPGIRRVDLTIEIAGRTFNSSHPAIPNLKYSFVWDGRDAYGRRVNGKRMATITIGYVYPMVYASPEASRAWANGGGVPTSINRDQLEITMTQTWSIPLGALALQETGFGGWMLSAQRFYDGRGRVLLDGATIRSGDADNTGRASLRTLADKIFVMSLAPASDGSVYVADTAVVKKIDRSGVITTVAGKPPFQAFTPDGAPAAGSPIRAGGIAVGPDDTLYINEPGNFRVRRVVNGNLVTVAGNGENGFNSTVSVDGKLATTVPIANQGIAVGSDGTLYIAESQRVTAVGPDGTMRLVAGSSATPRNPDSGDGGPARAAGLQPRAITVGRDGSIYVLNASITVRRITPDGIINRVAGPGPNNQAAIAQDGQSATSGRIGTFLTGLAVTSNDTLLLMEANNHFGRVRAVSSSGILSTFAGNGIADVPPSPDGTLARAAAIPDTTYELKIGPDGSVFFPAIYGPPGQELRVLKTAPVLPNGGQIMIPSEDGAVVYVFEEGRHVRTVETLMGSTIYSFSYDGHGYLTAVIDADGKSTRIERDGSGAATAIVAPGGQRTTLTVSAGLLVRIANPAGEANEFTYDGLLMKARRDPRGNSSLYKYDENGRLQRDSDAAGGFISLVHSGGTNFTVDRTSAEGRTHHYAVTLRPDMKEERLATAPAGQQTLMVFGDGSSQSVDAAGSTTTALQTADPRFGAEVPLGSSSVRTPGGRTAALSLTRSLTLADRNNPLSLTSMTDTTIVNGRRYTTVTNTATRKSVTTSPIGRTTTASFDERGRVVSVDTPGLASTSVQYADGLLESVTSGTRQYRFAYNARREITSMTDSLSRTATFHYDDAGRVKRITFSDGRTTTFTYDANGNLTTLTPPGRPSHQFVYTPVNLPDTYTPPSVPGGGETKLVYDKDRQLAGVTRASGDVISILRDGAGRASQVETSQGDYRFGYAAGSGALASVEAPGSSRLEFTYDGSLLTSEVWSGVVAGSISYAYDNDFRVASENGISFGFDADGFLVSSGALTLTRDARNGLLTGTTLSDVSDSYVYNDHGEVTGYQSNYREASLLSIGYTRDNGGRVTAETQQTAGNTTTLAYDYDPAGRLIRVSKSGVAVAEYDYDLNGNRTAHRYLGGSATASYDVQDRLLSYGDTTYSYDADGQLRTSTTAGVTTTYRYDPFGNLNGVTRGTQSIEYVMDGANRRIGKKINGALTNGWLYGDQLRIVAELDASGNVTSKFVYGTRTNAPDYMIRGGAMYRLLSDHRGSPRLVVNVVDGTVAQRLDYDAFGNVVLDSNPGFQPFGFAGGLYDRDTGLVHFGAREYDPQTGRWLTKDPIGFEGGDSNLYAYATNDPINFIDPSGLLFGGTINAGEAYGEAALGTYADVLADPDADWYEKAGAAVGGFFSALWTPCTSDSTFAVLSTAAGAAGGLRAAGSKAAGTEFSHWIPGRALKSTPDAIRKGFGLSRANGNYVSAVEHALNDPYRYRFMSRAWKSTNPINSPFVRQLNRLPKAIAGTAAGGAVGGAALASGTNCGCS